MTLTNRITHQPKSNKEPTTEDLIFSIQRLLEVYLRMPEITNDEKNHTRHMLTILELLK